MVAQNADTPCHPPPAVASEPCLAVGGGFAQRIFSYRGNFWEKAKKSKITNICLTYVLGFSYLGGFLIFSCISNG
jgi:hypothetical protein